MFCPFCFFSVESYRELNLSIILVRILPCNEPTNSKIIYRTRKQLTRAGDDVTETGEPRAKLLHRPCCQIESPEDTRTYMNIAIFSDASFDSLSFNGNSVRR
jgi:hypothetical protein